MKYTNSKILEKGYRFKFNYHTISAIYGVGGEVKIKINGRFSYIKSDYQHYFDILKCSPKYDRDLFENKYQNEFFNYLLLHPDEIFDFEKIDKKISCLID